MDDQLTINIEDLTLGAYEFIEEFSGASYEQLLAMSQAGEGLPLKTLMAVIAVSLNPANPRQALDTVRGLKISEVKLAVQVT